MTRLDPVAAPGDGEGGAGIVVVAPIVPADVAPGYPPRRLAHGLQAARGLRRHVLAVHTLLNAMFVLALLYTITLVKTLLIPLVLAAFLGLAFNPIVAAGARRHIPRWLTASVLMISLIAGIGGGVGLLAQPAMGWFHDAPATLKTFVPRLKNLTQPFEAASRATQTLVNGQATRAPPPRQTMVAVSAWDVLSNAPKILAAVLTVVLLVFFFLIYGDQLLRRLVEIAPSFRYKRHAVVIVRSIQTEVSRYILTTALINITLGAATATMLWILHVPDPLLWGSIAMLANFIPYVGAITTTTVLLLVGMINFSHLGQAVLPALLFACITVVEGNLITPMILGRRMRVSPVAILIWLLIWGFLWGIPGALLAVPMLTSFKLVSERVRGWRWFSLMVQR
jgi:predicted PurR-regulated permease PerM